MTARAAVLAGVLVGCGPAVVAWECPGVVINEFMTKNDSWAVDETGATSDWIELYNPTESEVDLAGYRVSQGLLRPLANPPLGIEPEVDAVIPADGFLMVLADQRWGLEDDRLHLPFALNREASFLELWGPDEHGRELCERVEYPTQHLDWSYARHPDGAAEESFAISEPTPDRPNGEAVP